MSKNKSELLLEGYLRAHGYPVPEFEPQIEGTTRRPDYRLVWNQTEVLLEVKEFVAAVGELRAGGRFFNPYPPLQEKINAASRKFKDIDGRCCCLVLYNVNKPLVLLDWQHIYGAMLGKLGFSVPLRINRDATVAADSDFRMVFTSGGKMHRESKGEILAPQNRTISAIVVLGRVPIGERLFHHHLRELEATRGERFAPEEWFGLLERARCTPMDVRRRVLRVVVHENPYARVPLPAEFFRGPYDERYGGLDGRIQRLFRGHELHNDDAE